MPKRSGDSSTAARTKRTPTRTRRGHMFSLILSGVSELTPELSDAPYSATNGDIECNMSDGVAYLEFDRQAGTLQEAVTSAIRDVEGTGLGVRVVRVESEAANIIAKINAELLGTSS
jgi:hypothetical protein